jgi:hypothetical protein
MRTNKPSLIFKNDSNVRSFEKHSLSIDPSKKKATFFNEKIQLKDENHLMQHDSFVSDKQSFDFNNKINQLSESKSEVGISKKLENLNSFNRSEQEDLSHPRKATKSSIDINLDTEETLCKKRSKKFSSLKQKYQSEENVLKEPSKNIVQYVISQLCDPNQSFCDYLIRVHNKFMIQAGRSLCVSVCDSCEGTFNEDSRLGFNDNSLKKNTLSDVPGTKYINLAEQNSDLSRENFDYRKRSSMDGPIMRNRHSLKSRSKPNGSSFTGNSLQDTIHKFRLNLTNFKEKKIIPFCFCSYCQMKLMKSIKDLEIGVAGEESEVKLRLNRLIMEFKKMGLIKKEDILDSYGENKAMTLSEKIMKGVIDNLLLKSLNDSRDQVRIQTFHSLNKISSDFFHFLVSSNL